ncbi:hypothetical protein G6F16_010999 [Rhizopus arrhizus]|uniref:Uncharacterized protein n=1 Tax=Rhizopus oryzae TaxID=64495 RepID=A0A9P6WYU4_RHIOR|nr:hypothetical protein G6F20_010865 [Rhizopus arrhizus]KAG0822655.1 hypothetical protein G6F19_011241 [Rhizopus arrhizus]KAG0823030.1 hypothetical protein G6F18_011507 [Rhizopus arrhizus]KAG0864449.1 hypothetical protein G6F16_010999 [Rhizopus arrhizus]KAG0872914.1 hypothetical protein G6F15_010998 [Rhizopus arrhizus]
MNITRDQAICRFFCEDYSKENAARLSKKIEELGTFDVCYENDPKRPVLVHLSVIRNDPTTFKRCLTECSALNLKEAVETKPELVSERQVIMFLNEVYKSTDTQNEAVYCLQEVDNKEVYESVISKTDCMSKKSEVAFATWCSRRKVNFIGVPFTRKRSRETNKRCRKLYVMKNEFREGIIETIATSIPRYQNYINSLKKQGRTIIGMVQCLKERSLCDMVFVSWSCSADSNFSSRDMNDSTDLLNELTGVDGDIQSMISYISSSETDVCLVAIDFAGLSTNIGDLQNFFNGHKKLTTV